MTATEEWSALLYRLLLFAVLFQTWQQVLLCKYNAHAAKSETAVNSNQSTKEKT